MGIFDFFTDTKKKSYNRHTPKKTDKEPKSQSSKKEVEIKAQPVVQDHRMPVAKVPRKRPGAALAATEQADKKGPINIIKDRNDIENNLQLIEEPNEKICLEFYCPVVEANIICHSILVDKLGDLTKFIILSLYKGHSIDEIIELTQMGYDAIADEIQFLIRGNLATNNNEALELTELGKEYGDLLVQFEKLSAGIPVYFNTVSDSFEDKTITTYDSVPDNAFILTENYIPVLTRNDNYSNSLKIAKETIQNGNTFCWELRDSLYTSVSIDKDSSTKKYRRVSLSEFDYVYRNDKGACITVAVPYDRIAYRLRYSKVDEYRASINDIQKVYDEHPNLVTKKAADIVNMSNEEHEAEVITRDINCVTGNVKSWLTHIEEKELTENMLVLDGKTFSLKVNSKMGKGIYLEEINRKRYYEVSFYHYRHMEIE